MPAKRLEIRLLGRFAVLRDDEEVPARAFGGRQVRTLIRILASRPGEFVPKDALADALWAERLPAHPATSLEVLIHRARRALGEPSRITTGPGGYAFSGGDGCRIDAEELRALTAAGRAALEAGDWARALNAFGRALEWWRGEPLAEDVYADWAQPLRAELARLQLEALEGAAAAALRIGHPRRAVEFAEMAGPASRSGRPVGSSS